MTRNMGTVDRSIRTLIAIGVAAGWATGTLGGLPLAITGTLATIFVITSMIGFCPLYRLVGLNTCPADR